MDLIDHWVVGFSGKRKLDNAEAVRAVLRDVIRSLRELTDGQLVAVSSAAVGADSLFVDEAMKLGIPWICVLPFPENAFFNDRDFPDPHERETARQKLIEAADCEVVRTPQTLDELADSTWRRAAFAEAGFKCVDEADIVITVLHDAVEGGKPGGSAEVLAYARTAKRPLIIIDPETLEVRRENWPARLHDRVTDWLRRLPTENLAETERATLPTIAAIRLAEWRSSIARAARKHVPGIRRRLTAIVLLHGFATIITAYVFLLLPHELAGRQLLFEFIALICVATGFYLLISLRSGRRQTNAANYRLAAEIGRSILATWSIPEAGSEIARNVPAEFKHFARNLLLYQRRDPDRPRGLHNLSPEDVNKLAVGYVENRIKAQIKYYRKYCDKASRAAHRIELTSILLSFTAVLCALILVLGHLFNIAQLNKGFGFAKLTAATLAPIAVIVLVIHEIKRREARYDEMEKSLKYLEERMHQVRSVTALRDAVVDVERMLLSESHEWWVLAKANVAA